MKKFITLIFVCISAFALAACGNKDKDEPSAPGFSKVFARNVCDDGWVYTFDYQYLNDGSIDEDAIPFLFYGINIRYRNTDGSVMILGEEDIPEIRNDMKKIAGILDYESRKVTKEELLAINPEEYMFDVIDKDMFFDLMKEALNGEPQKTGRYTELPSYAMLTENGYTDGYIFQIGFVGGMGSVDAIFIDVLYKSDKSDCGYIQLSDMVDNSTADAEQERLSAVINSIMEGIVRENDLNFGYEENNDMVIDGVELSRLYIFLEDIADNNLDKYRTD